MTQAMVGADQLIFTSCRYAFGGGSGFQVKSQSHGIAVVDLNTVIQRSDYQRPAPSEGVSMDDPANCPVAVRWYVLPSGGRALTRMVYLGTDYTGRPGNFLAHTLVFTAAEASRVDPVAWMDWDGWLDVLPPGADDSAHVPALPRVTWTPGVTVELRLPREATAGALAGALDALFEATVEGRPLMLRSEVRDNLDWFRLLARCLPRAYLGRTEFSTFEHNLRSVPALAMTVDGTAISVHASGHYGFVGFDLVKVARSVAPAVAPATTEARATDRAPSQAGRTYGAIVARIVFEQRELWPRFQQLLAQLALLPGADLAAIAQIFLLVETGEEPDASPLELVRFVLSSLAKPLHTAVLPHVMARLPAELVPEARADRHLLTAAWAFTISLDRQPEYGAPAAQAYLFLLLGALQHWPAEEASVDSALDALAGAWGPGFEALVLRAFRQHAAAASAAIVSASAAGATALIQYVAALQEDVENAPEVEALVHALVGSDRSVAERLEAIVVETRGATQRAALFEMANRTPGGVVSNRVALLGEVLLRSCLRLPAYETAELRARVPLSMLLAEWEAALAGGDYKAVARAHADPLVRQRLTKAYRVAMLHAAARAFARTNAVDSLYEVVDHLERRRLLVTLPTADRTRWATVLNEGLRIDATTDHARERMALIGREKARLQITLRPDRGALVRRLAALVPGCSLTDTHLAVLADHQGLADAERRHVQARLFDFAFSTLAGKRDGGLHVALMTGQLRPTGHDAAGYREALEELVRRSDAGAIEALLTWWFFDAQSAECRSLWSAVVRELADASVRIDETAVAPAIRTKFTTAAQRKNVHLARVEQWQEAYEHGVDGGMLRTVGRRVSSLLQGLSRKKL